MDRGRFNGRDPGGGRGGLIAVPETELRAYREAFESSLAGGDGGWLAAAGGAGGVAATTLAWALVRPTRFPPLVTGGAAASASFYAVYWLRSHLRRQRGEQTLGLLRSRLGEGAV